MRASLFEVSYNHDRSASSLFDLIMALSERPDQWQLLVHDNLMVLTLRIYCLLYSYMIYYNEKYYIIGFDMGVVWLF